MPVADKGKHCVTCVLKPEPKPDGKANHVRTYTQTLPSRTLPGSLQIVQDQRNRMTLFIPLCGHFQDR
eukprot:1902085-Amphidinium_carterae.7